AERASRQVPRCGFREFMQLGRDFFCNPVQDRGRRAVPAIENRRADDSQQEDRGRTMTHSTVARKSWRHSESQARAGSRMRRKSSLPPSRPLLERLEERTLLTTITVQNSNPSGANSLSAAIAAAQSGDTIMFHMGPQYVTSPITLSGQLELTQNVTITGPGS